MCRPLRERKRNAIDAEKVSAKMVCFRLGMIGMVRSFSKLVLNLGYQNNYRIPGGREKSNLEQYLKRECQSNSHLDCLDDGRILGCSSGFAHL